MGNQSPSAPSLSRRLSSTLSLKLTTSLGTALSLAQKETPLPVYMSVDGKMSSLSLSSRLNYSTAPTGVDSEVALLASLAAQEQDQEKVRNPVDLVIVLDKSGSMQGPKLELCKKTLDFLIEQGLTENDSLALVTFDSNVYVDFAGGKMTKPTKELLMSKVNALRSGTSTNLCDGLMKGIELLKKFGTAEVSAICVLTDGQMNQGVTNPDEVAKLAMASISAFPKGKAKPSVFTFGYGVDADSTAMKIISEATGGSFYAIQNPESVPISFADCLGGLTAVAAQTVELTCEVSGGGAELAGDPLTKFPFEKLSASVCKIKIKDMYCGERRDLILKIRIPKLASDAPIKIILTCKFMDTIHETFSTLTATNEITRYAGESLPTEPADAEVVRHLVRLEAAKVMEEARMSGERGDIAGGRARLDAMLTKTTHVLTALGVSEEEDVMMAEVAADLRLASKNMVSASQFNSYGRSQMQSAAQSHAFQRSNKVDSMMGSDDFVERSAYANQSKKQMMKSAKSAFGYS